MRTIRKKIITDENRQPVAVEIDYNDWLEIERLLSAQQVASDDLNAFFAQFNCDLSGYRFNREEANER